MKTKKEIILGAHVSISGGIQNSVLRAAALETNALQIFVKNNRQWKVKYPTTNEIEEFKNNIKICQIKYPIAHATYLINLSSSSSETREKSYETLKAELKICSELEIPYLVLHPGSNKDEKNNINYISEYINKIYTENKHITTSVLLETMAGQGGSFGKSFKELSEIYNKINQKEKIGYCFDTCHVFASGYDIANKPEEVFDEFNKILGLENLKLFHLNDSKKDLGSNVDRHEHIGLGKIGINAFKYIMNKTEFEKIPKIIETPKNTETDDTKNLNTLRKL